MIEHSSRLALRLRSETSLQEALNLAFDKIGFTESFIDKRIEEKSVGRNKKTTLVKDLVWGMMEFSPSDMELIDTPIIQTLRGKKQLGLTYQVYPSADHTRFAHTLGVAHTSKRYLKEIASFDTEIRLQTTTRLDHSRNELQVYSLHDDQERAWLTETVVHAALLHDAGHFPFSHATESALHDNLEHFTIGDWTAKQLINEFLDYIPGLRDPKLAELFSILIVLSARFRHFYKQVVLETTSENDIDKRLNSIALLILGKPHQDNFPGLAQIISSNAVDADKVDYVQRDSKLCNIPVGVDVARLFYRSCFLRVSGEQLRRIDRRAKGEKIFFLLNASGIDTAEEMVHSRAVLFHRVYRHKTTRLLERIWSKDLYERSNLKAKSGLPKSISQIWASTESEMLSSVGVAKFPDQAFHRAVVLRQIPRRVAILNFDVARYPFHDLGFLPLEMAEKVSSREKEIVGGYLKSLEFDSRSFNGKHLSEIEHEISRTAQAISQLVEPNVNYDFVAHLVPMEPSESSKVSSQLTLEKSVVRSRKPENRQAQQALAMSANKNAGYVFAESQPLNSSIEEVMLLSTLMTLDAHFTKLNILPPALLTENTEIEAKTDPKSKEKNLETELSFAKSVPSLTFDAKKICQIIGADFGRYEAIANVALSSPQFKDYSRLLWHSSDSSDEIAARFSSFNGVGGWRVTAKHVEGFISQFPVHLREEVTDLLKKFVVLGRHESKASLLRFLDEIGYDTAVYAFTRTSGVIYTEMAKSELFDEIAPKGVSFPGSFNELKLEAKKGKNILFFDDNVSSGFQGEAVLNRLHGIPKSKWDKRLLGEWNKVSDHRKISDLNCKVSFGFMMGSTKGVNVLQDKWTSLGNTGEVLRWEDPENLLREMPLSKDLTDFMQEVGTELVSKSRGCSSEEATSDSLGYENMQCLFSSVLNAPTSLITCFWLPGIFKGRPWLPLIIRRAYERQLSI